MNVRKLFSLVPVCLFVLTLSAAAFGIPIAEYREKVHRNTALLAGLTSGASTQNLAAQKQILAQLTAQISPIEKVDVSWGTFEVDNAPLLEKIKALDAEPLSPRRRQLIADLYQNSSALENKLQELERQQTSNVSKDEEKQKLSEILKRVEYQKPPEPKGATGIQKLINDFLEWIAGLFPKAKMGEPSPGMFQGLSSVLQVIIIAVALGLIAFLIIRFGPQLAARFRRDPGKKKKSRVILGESLTENETSQTLFDEAERLARDGNLRGAVRKAYIALLCELSDRKIIGLARHKTNRDYMRDVRSRAGLFQNMGLLTGSFERAWYGFGTPNEADWETFRDTYKKTMSDDSLK